MAKSPKVTSTGNPETNSGVAAAADLQVLWQGIKGAGSDKANALDTFGKEVCNKFDAVAAIGAKYALASKEVCDGVLAAAMGADAESKSYAKAKSEMRLVLMCGAKGLWDRAKAAVDATKAAKADLIHSQNRKDKTLTAARRLIDGKSSDEIVAEFTVGVATTLQEKSANKLIKAVETSKGDGPAVAALLAEFKATWRKLVALPDIGKTVTTAPAQPAAPAPAAPAPVVDFASIWANIGQLPAAEQPKALAALLAMPRA